MLEDEAKTEEIVTKADPLPAERLKEEVTRAIEIADGDVQQATGILTERVMSDMVLYHYIADPLIRAACYDQVRKVMRSRRTTIWTAPNFERTMKGKRSIARAKRMLLDFPLLHGKLLRFATRADVVDAELFYRKQGNDMLNKADWLRLIAEKTPANTVVGNALTEDKLRELKVAIEGK